MWRLILIPIGLGILFGVGDPANSLTKNPSPKRLSKTIALETFKVTHSHSDTFSLLEAKLRKLYINALSDFIETVRRVNKISFDTIYLGKHRYGRPDDFPNIELPEKIQHTYVKMISPELGKKMTFSNRQVSYVNMMGWIDQNIASFTMVIFSKDLTHQFDYHLDYRRAADKVSYNLIKINLENYSNMKEGKVKKQLVYLNHTYVN